MGILLSTSEMEVLRKHQRNLGGSPDYACVTCILMLGLGNSPFFIASCIGINVSTVYRYEGYWEHFDSRQLVTLCKKLREYIYTDAKSVAAWIKSTFGVEYILQLVADLPNRIGFTYKRWKKAIIIGFYRTKEKFRQAVRDFFYNIEKYKKEEFEVLLTLKFRLCNLQTIF